MDDADVAVDECEYHGAVVGIVDDDDVVRINCKGCPDFAGCVDSVLVGFHVDGKSVNGSPYVRTA